MERRAYGIEVVTDEDSILLRSLDGGPDEYLQVIRVSPDQVDSLVKWLIDAKAEFAKAEFDAEFAPFPSAGS